ncbi:MAG TPA: hypothetical protein VHX14_23845 [Thermoanaerobaculia bacterium]|jgi:hypothetical protein|nr:hypothetical protein [Thermoanaerobaculia bacterium]
MNDVGVLAIVTGLALVSALLTFVLFKFLDAQAEGKGKLLGGTIRYGGSLAGFVLLFSLLFGAFYKIRGEPGVTTPISLAGDWTVEEQTSKQITLKGSATIKQRRHDPVLELGGEIAGGHATTFISTFGLIHGRNIYFIYENADGERGLIRGQAVNDSPASLRLIYTDLVGYDRNNDPSGVLLLTRRK